MAKTIINVRCPLKVWTHLIARYEIKESSTNKIIDAFKCFFLREKETLDFILIKFYI